MEKRIHVNGIEVLEQGQGDDTVVMIHGWPDTHRLWDRQVEALQANHRCIRFTLPGYDRAHVRRMYDLQALIDQIAAIVDAVSPDKPVTLLIHDWGCVFGYQYYLRHSSRVKRIVAVDIGDAGSRDHEIPTKAKLFIAGYQLWLATAWNIGGGIGDAMTRKMASILKAPGEPASIHSGMTYSYWWKWSHTLTKKPLGVLPLKVECPLLFIYGADKKVTFHSRKWEAEMAAKAGNRVEAFPTGHWVMAEEPERFTNLVVEWLGADDAKSVEPAPETDAEPA
ncbi:alpha/beta fold hydrolase [Ferrimonas sp. SCSIO 43195]|uniref:alpha/beta fold hydrolase n=1 Tax=Ferrimonas sp. SCSIO 43195 TaxID=2822844 RepID=UPI0020761AD0|nr:alpha/beta hydrolase [Ferrimonas sp. SCSIO 43195]USD35756.1 alpha/beta hydrolase [Ferrimonas sp. SCSIO 43195]